MNYRTPSYKRCPRGVDASQECFDLRQVIKDTIGGREVRLTRESATVSLNEPTRLATVYCVIEVGGTHYVWWPVTPDDTETSVKAQLGGWVEDRPLVFGSATMALRRCIVGPFI